MTGNLNVPAATAAAAASGSDESWNTTEECADFGTYIDLLIYIDSYQVGLSCQIGKICFYSELYLRVIKCFLEKLFDNMWVILLFK